MTWAESKDAAMKRAIAPEISREDVIARLTDSEPQSAPTCAWCPGWVPTATHESHGMCVRCQRIYTEQIDRDDVERINRRRPR
jgi:hypothetical protein